MKTAAADTRIVRLSTADHAEARVLFTTMAAVFGEGTESLSVAYIDTLLGSEAFWALAAIDGDDIIGGLTAHTLPMTRSASREIFIYDLAVRPDHQRCGVGRRLVTTLRELAAESGIVDVFVPADEEDTHALDFYRALGAVATPVTFFTFSRDER